MVNAMDSCYGLLAVTLAPAPRLNFAIAGWYTAMMRGMYVLRERWIGFAPSNYSKYLEKKNKGSSQQNQHRAEIPSQSP
jgi:hypothetical protein